MLSIHTLIKTKQTKTLPSHTKNNNKTFWQPSRVDVIFLVILIVDEESEAQAWRLSNTSPNSKETLMLGGNLETVPLGKEQVQRSEN